MPKLVPAPDVGGYDHVANLLHPAGVQRAEGRDHGAAPVGSVDEDASAPAGCRLERGAAARSRISFVRAAFLSILLTRGGCAGATSRASRHRLLRVQARRQLYGHELPDVGGYDHVANVLHSAGIQRVEGPDPADDNGNAVQVGWRLRGGREGTGDAGGAGAQHLAVA